MGIETITEKILAEANDDARRIYEKGRYDGRSAIYNAERLIKQRQSEQEEKLSADMENIKKRRSSVAQLEARKMRLAAKQEAISDCFDEAVRKLAELPEDEYIELLVKTIEGIFAEAVSEGGVSAQNGELLLNKRDRERIGQTLIKQVNQEGKTGRLTLSEDTIDAAGGFVLRSGTVEINSTLEVMVEAVRSQVTSEVIGSLFGERE